MPGAREGRGREARMVLRVWWEVLLALSVQVELVWESGGKWHCSSTLADGAGQDVQSNAGIGFQ